MSYDSGSDRTLEVGFDTCEFHGHKVYARGVRVSGTLKLFFGSGQKPIWLIWNKEKTFSHRRLFLRCIQNGSWWSNSLPSLRCRADTKRGSATGELRQGPHFDMEGSSAE